MGGCTSSIGSSSRVYSQSRKAAELREVRAKQRAEKRCWNCGKPLDCGGLLCTGCADRNRMGMAALREKKRFAGICHHCPEPAVPLRISCQRHLDDNAGQQRRRYWRTSWLVAGLQLNVNRRLSRDAEKVVELGWI